MEDTQPLKLFDATCMLGRWAAGVSQTPATASELTAEMAYYGLAEALVYHSVAMMYNPRAGNQRLMSDLAGAPNLHPCWVLMPHQTGEVDPPEQVVAAMLAQGVHAALLLPRNYRFMLRRWNIGPLLARLAEHRIPLFVDFGQRHWDGELIDWDGIEEVCAAYPELPLALVRADLNGNRRLFPLMERLPNLHIETSYYVTHRGIELLCRTFGASRVLFGSGLPFRDPGPAITALMYSQISESERALVGGGNLRRLLGGGALMTEMTIQERAARGLPLNDLLIIDAHAHFGECSTVHAPFGDAQGMLASMDRISVRTTCISAHMSIGADYHWGNDQVAEAAREHPGRFAGYVFINPNYPQDIETEIARGMDRLGLWAVKIHPSINEYPPEGPAYQRVYAIMQERKGLVLSHTFGKVEILDKLSAAYPDITFINAHIGGGYDGRQPANWLSLVRERPNVYVDIVASPVPYGGLAKLVAEVGADKILFGTDTPFCDTAHQIGKVTHARLSDEDKRKILGLNMLKLMQRHHAVI